MKRFRQLTALLLIVLLVGSVFPSCSGRADSEQQGESGQNETTAAPPAEDAVPEPEETRPRHSVDTESLDFGGEDLVSAVCNWQGYLSYFFADEYTGDIMNDAIYSRRVKAEDVLNISMRTDRYAELEYMSQIKKLFAAGDHAFDLMFNHCIQDICRVCVRRLSL